MTPRDLARQLLAKAAQDETLVDRVLEDAGIADEVIGFHCQQAAEKMLKAVLAAHAVEFRRTHDLVELADRLADSKLPLPETFRDLDMLIPFAVEARYDFLPPTSVSLDRHAVRDLIRRLRTWCEAQVGRVD